MKAALNDPNNWTLWKCIKEGDGTEEQRNLPLTFQLERCATSMLILRTNKAQQPDAVENPNISFILSVCSLCVLLWCSIPLMLPCPPL